MPIIVYHWVFQPSYGKSCHLCALGTYIARKQKNNCGVNDLKYDI